MMRIVARSKLHGLRVTDTVLQYGGSLTLDVELMRIAQLVPAEKVQTVNVSNGERLETYLIEGEPRSAQCVLNGPAARKGQIGDLIHVISYGIVDVDESTDGLPLAAHVDANNRPVT